MNIGYCDSISTGLIDDVVIGINPVGPGYTLERAQYPECIQLARANGGFGGRQYN